MSGLGNREIFAKNLSRFVARSGKSQKEIAEVLDVSPASFNNWINGIKYPRIDKIERIANYFGILKSDLIEEEKEDSPGQLQLTEGEKAILALFRQVPAEHQDMVVEMIRVALKQKE